MEMINLLNIDTSNPLAGLSNNSVKNVFSKLDANNGQSSFAKMLSMILGENTSEQTAETNSVISNKDIDRLIQFCNQDDKSNETNQLEYNNLSNMIFGLMQNTAYPEFKNINFENDAIDLNFIAAQPSSVISEVSDGNYDVGNKYFQNLLGERETVINVPLKESNLQKIHLQENSLQKNNFTLKNKLSNDKQFNITPNNSSDKIISAVQDDTSIKEITSGFKLSDKALPDESLFVLKNKTTNDKNMDLRGNIVENKKHTVDVNNKIIEVSDQSSEIKSSVLSQVKDKIIFMANEKAGMQEVTMELYPKDLGKVNIKMSLKSEKITVEIMASNLKTVNILETNVNELTKTLQNNFDSGTVTVTVAEDGLNQYNQSNLNYSQHNNQGQKNYNKQNFNNNEDNIDETNIISEIINLRNLKLNKVV